MNATEKAEILKSKGYFYTTSNFATTKHRWYKNSVMIAAGASYAIVTKMAYQHYLDAQKEAQSNQPESVESDEPEGFMHPCENCGGSGVEINREGYSVHCYDCDGTGIHQDSELELVIPQPLAELEMLRQQVASHAEWASVVKRQWDELLAEKVKLEGDLQAAQEKHAKDSRINLNLSEENATLRRGIETEIVYHRHSIEVNGRYNDAFYLGRVDAANHAKTRLEMLLVKPLPTEALESTEAVTLSESEIELLAKMYNGECFIGLGDLLGEVGKRLLVFSKKRGIFTEYHLDAEYRIPKNAFAIQARYEQLIEARRLQLSEKA